MLSKRCGFLRTQVGSRRFYILCSRHFGPDCVDAGLQVGLNGIDSDTQLVGPGSLLGLNGVDPDILSLSDSIVPDTSEFPISIS